MPTSTSGVTPGVTTGTALTNIQSIVIAEALYNNEVNRVMPLLVYHTDIPKGAYQKNVPRFARMTAYQATEGADFTATSALRINSVNFIADEHVASAIVTSRLARQMSEDDARVVGRLLQDALSRIRETDLLALFTGFSEDVPGAGSTLGIEHLRGSLAWVQTENNADYGAAMGPFSVVLHPEQISDIVEDLSVTAQTATATYGAGTAQASGDLATAVLREHLRGMEKVYGIKVYSHGLITRDASDDASGAVLGEQALGIAEAGEVENWVEKDNSGRATEYGIVGNWREGELVDSWGVEILSDAIKTI